MTVWFQIPDLLKKYEEVVVDGQQVLAAKVEDTFVNVEFPEEEKTFVGYREVEVVLSHPIIREVKPKTTPRKPGGVMRPGKTERQAEARRRWEENRMKRAEENRARAQNAGAGKKKR